MPEDPIVIVDGASIISACGGNVPTWDAMVRGRTGARRIESPLSSLPGVNIAAPVFPQGLGSHQKRLLQGIERKYDRRWGLGSQVAVLVADDLFKHYPLSLLQAFTGLEMGISFGIAEGAASLREAIILGLAARQHAFEEDPSNGKKAVPVLSSVEAIGNMPAFHVSQAFNLYGPNITFAGACAAGIQALWGAGSLLKNGEADIVVTGGSEDLVSGGTILSTFHLMKVMTSILEGQTAAQTPTAFDKNSRGFVLGAGGVSMMVMKKSLATRFNMPIVATVRGFGHANDGIDRAVPDENGVQLARAIRLAISRSGLTPDDIDVVFTHGAGTPAGDVAEVAALRDVFADCTEGPFITAIKPIVGHMMGAASAASIWAAQQSIKTGIIPPIANLTDPIDDVLRFVMGSSVRTFVKHALVLGVGLGGINEAVVVSAI